MKLANQDSFQSLQALKQVEGWHIPQLCIDILLVWHVNCTSIEMIGLSQYKIDSSLRYEFKKTL